MPADELTRALLLEEVAAPQAIAEALFASVNRGAPLLQTLVDVGATSPDVLARYLGRAEAPFLRQVVALPELVDRLPPGLCARLLAIPVRRDPITAAVDVAVADPSDPHPRDEIAFHLRAPVRVVRAPVAAIEEALRRLERAPRRRGLVLDTDSSPPSATPAQLPRPRRIQTPPWGTPIHAIETGASQSGDGSEIPIPLTRKTVHPATTSGRTARPPAFVDPIAGRLGEGYAFDATDLRDVVERSAPPRIGTFIPGPPPLPGASGVAASAPQIPFSEMGGILAALRDAGARDEVMELVLSGARTIAHKVALFVVKNGDYVAWLSTPEFAARAALHSSRIPLDADSIFDHVVREGLYLGPIDDDELHAPLLRAMKNPSRDVAAVPIHVSGKTAVIIVADELGDAMIGTRRLEELARAAGDAFARIVCTRR